MQADLSFDVLQFARCHSLTFAALERMKNRCIIFLAPLAPSFFILAGREDHEGIIYVIASWEGKHRTLDEFEIRPI